MNLQELNNLEPEEAYDAFEKCCTSSTWIINMVNERPFDSKESLFTFSDNIWAKCNENDWLEACDGHPKIGDVSSLKEKYATTKQWAGNEQSGMDTASDDIINKLAKGNTDYETKFGYIFIVCATGKSAKEMHDLLEIRLNNEPEQELKIAMGEQNKITHLRLEKLLN